jgi:selenocysteine-specific elongation factor
MAGASTPVPIASLRAALVHELRRQATVGGAAAARIVDQVLAALVSTGRLERSGDRLGPPGGDARAAALEAAMDRLAELLSVPAPPALAAAAVAADCPREGIPALEAAGRIVRVEDDLAWSSATYDRLTAIALELADASELTPAALRDATGTSRRYVLAILEDLGRKGILARTPHGHVRGPRAARPAGSVR